MTNKLVVITNSLKVPNIKRILLYVMKFLVPNYSCLQNPWLGGYHPQIPVLSALCPQLNLLNPPPPNKIPGYATAVDYPRGKGWCTDKGETRIIRNKYFVEPQTKNKTLTYLLYAKYIYGLRLLFHVNSPWFLFVLSILFEHSTLNRVISHILH